MANLDIDGSDDGTDFDPVDIRLLFNFCGEGADDDTALLKNTPHSKLTGAQRTAKAKAIRDKINEMVNSLDIDNSDNGEDFDPVDIRLLFIS